MKDWYCLEGENPEDHKFIRMKIWVTETWYQANKNGDERKHGEEDNEERNGKQQCDNVSFLAESVVKKWREKTEEKWYHLTSMPYMPNVWLSYQRTSKLPCSICSKKAARKKISIHGAELEQRREENKMMKDEFSASYLMKKTRSQMPKDEFSASYMKKKIVPH